MSRRLRAGRGGRGRGGRGGSGALGPLLGLTGFTGAIHAQTASPGGVQGINTGFWVAIAFSVISQASSANRTLLGTLGAGVGWEIRTTTFNAGIIFVASNGAGSAISTTSFVIPAGHVGKEMMAVFVHTGAGDEVIPYIDAVQAGAAVACVGYTPNTARMRVGARLTGSQPATDITVYDWAGGHAVPTLAQVQAYFDAWKATRRMSAMPGVATQSAWDVTDIATINDSIATDHMTVTGTPTLVSKPAPVYTW